MKKLIKLLSLNGDLQFDKTENNHGITRHTRIYRVNHAVFVIHGCGEKQQQQTIRSIYETADKWSASGETTACFTASFHGQLSQSRIRVRTVVETRRCPQDTFASGERISIDGNRFRVSDNLRRGRQKFTERSP